MIAIGIIVLAGCKKEENNDNQLDSSEMRDGSVWEGSRDCSFEYEDENVNVYLSSRIVFIEGNTAEFRLVGLPDGETINRRVGYRSGWAESYFDFDGKQVFFNTDYRRRLEVNLNSSVAGNCGPKTQALFDQNNNSITIQLNYIGDSVI